MSNETLTEWGQRFPSFVKATGRSASAGPIYEIDVRGKEGGYGFCDWTFHLSHSAWEMYPLTLPCVLVFGASKNARVVVESTRDLEVFAMTTDALWEDAYKSATLDRTEREDQLDNRLDAAESLVSKMRELLDDFDSKVSEARDD